MGISITAKQETVDKSLNLRKLALGQLTVAMTIYDAPAHAVGDAELFPHLTCSLGRDKHGRV